ncbi:MAG: hypothetical protein U9O41_04660 [Candidatus Aerophobetes bacterium]|nr:hypothetical protein [Candidatus Aerophobetes bacterium]
MRKVKGFLLVEVLTIVAIIGIIAGIVIPNIMSANMRAKIKGVEADMASIAIALENYRADYGTYPLQPESAGYDPDEIGKEDEIFGEAEVVGLGKLIFPFDESEPTYLNRVSGDIFNDEGMEEWATSEPGQGKHNNHYCYFTGKAESGGGRANTESTDTKADYWALVSYGPDKDLDIASYTDAWKAVDPNASGYDPSKAYDPENGTISEGDIIIIGP